MNVEPILLGFIPFLWVVLLFVLGKGALRAFKQKKMIEGIIVMAVIVLVLIFTTEFVAYITWLLACWSGLPIACIE